MEQEIEEDKDTKELVKREQEIERLARDAKTQQEEKDGEAPPIQVGTITDISLVDSRHSEYKVTVATDYDTYEFTYDGINDYNMDHPLVALMESKEVPEGRVGDLLEHTVHVATYNGENRLLTPSSTSPVAKLVRTVIGFLGSGRTGKFVSSLAFEKGAVAGFLWFFIAMMTSLVIFSSDEGTAAVLYISLSPLLVGTIVLLVYPVLESLKNWWTERYRSV